MNRLNLILLKGTLLGLCLFVTTMTAFSQSTCPCSSSCNPCSGGISFLSLKYNGSTTALIIATDNLYTPFMGIVQPGEVFNVAGQSNGKFSGSQVYLSVNAAPEAPIPVTCAFQFDPSVTYGSFSIVAAASKNGGILCCTANANPVAPPVITGCPANVQVTAGAVCSGVATWIAPATADCDIASFTSNYVPGSVFPLGITQVVYTAVDTDNLTSTCKFNITVVDGTIPTVVKATANVIVNAGSDCKAIASWTPPEFADNCGSVTVSKNHEPGTAFSMGTTDVTYTARDVAGNTITSKFQVIVKDVTAPLVDKCPADIVVNASSGCSAKATWTPPVFTDGSCGAVTVTSSFVPGSEFPAGKTEVVYTGTDNSNNVTTCKFYVLVKDGSAPILSACPADIKVKTALSPGSESIEWTSPTATDDCTEVTLTSTHQPGDVFPIGITKVDYVAQDLSGNETKCSFKVTVAWEDTELSIVQLVTPDGNELNDQWTISNIEKYDHNKVVIVDRWGNVIYEEHNYDNDRNVWKGKTSSGNSVPTGTYFYTITIYSGPKAVEKRGFIEVLR